MENPATLATCGAPKNDLAGCSIASENTESPRVFQARQLARSCGITFTMASIIAPLLHGETVH
jgi:hypothetical protein